MEPTHTAFSLTYVAKYDKHNTGCKSMLLLADTMYGFKINTYLSNNFTR